MKIYVLVPVAMGGGPASELLRPGVGGVPGGGGHEGGLLSPQDRAGGVRPRHHAGLQVSQGLIGENLQKKRYHIYIKILVPDVCLVCRLCRYVCRCCPGEQCGCQQMGLYLNIVTFSTRWGNTGNRGNTQN